MMKYEATKSEREILIHDHDYNPALIDALDAKSDDIRKGIPVNMYETIVVCDYQSILQEIRKISKKWWKFWAD